MKKLLAIAAAALMAMAGTAMAADSGTLTVSANIIPSCIVSDGTLAFGALNPLTAPVVTAISTGVEVTCTNGTVYSLTTTGDKGSASNPGTLISGANTINYTIAFASSGTGTGAAVGVPITGTIPAGSYNAAPPGTYADTIVLNVTP